jgi:hypothetical protein
MRWLVNDTTRPLYACERPGILCIGGWVCCRADLDGCGKSLPTGIRSSDRPGSGESLYELRYPGPHDIQGVPGGKDLTSGECSLG